MIVEQARGIRLLAMDVDGVLTNGDITYTDTGIEIKAFNILDGLGIAVAGKAGLITAIVTGRTCAAIERRALELGVTHLRQGVRDKGAALRELLRDTGLTAANAAFVGDDINDIPAFREVGWKVAVRNASRDIRDMADYVTEREGGRGAAREVVEMILGAQGKWDDAVREFLNALEQSECGS